MKKEVKNNLPLQAMKVLFENEDSGMFLEKLLLEIRIFSKEAKWEKEMLQSW